MKYKISGTSFQWKPICLVDGRRDGRIWRS